MFSKTKKNAALPGTATISETDGSLVINCKGCDQFPEPSSAKCTVCICEGLSQCGMAEKIKLLGIKDTEISGDAAELFCGLSQITLPLISCPGGRRCSRCSRSPENLMASLWEDFPDIPFATACARLYCDRNDGPECAGCLQRTYAALSNCDAQMRAVTEKAAEAARRCI